MSARSEQAAVVAVYRRMVEELNAQSAVLHANALAPVVRFLEGHQQLAEQALRELDHAAGMEDGPEPTPEQRQRWAEFDAVFDARYGDLMPQNVRPFMGDL